MIFARGLAKLLRMSERKKPNKKVVICLNPFELPDRARSAHRRGTKQSKAHHASTLAKALIRTSSERTEDDPLAAFSRRS
jgi:hypothetical protein